MTATWRATLTGWWSTPVTRALLALLLMIAIGGIFNADGAFFRWSVHRDMLRQVSVHGMLACGMTVVIITAGIDLSVSSLLALAAVSFAWLTLPHGWPAVLAIPLVLAFGTALGSVSGALVARMRIQPFIVTLAMMVFARGLAKVISGGRKITNYVSEPDGTTRLVDLPGIFGSIDSRVLGGNLSIVTIIFLLCVLVTWVVLSRLRLGRHIYAVGGNEEAARLSGVPVRRTLILAYALSGLFAAVAGICQAAQETHGDPETGMAYELDAIAMVVIGGTTLAGGKGSVVLTLIGVLTIGYLQKILSLNAAPEATRLMLTGAIIICAVLFQRGKA
ncbi:MAG: ABC transporter permease [Gemmatimonadales bacterium]|jgi:ribose transport system permease protein